MFEEPVAKAPEDVLLSQGAEARVWLSRYLGQEAVLKQRFSKQYRHSSLDKRLTAARLKQEVRAILRARKLGVPTPVVLNVELEASTIYFGLVRGPQLKEALAGGALGPADTARVLGEVGRAVALLHDGDVVHGDLTTSNLLLAAPDHRLVVIDFGLSYNTNLPEDKAVDLYVLERAFSVHQAAGGQARPPATRQPPTLSAPAPGFPRALPPSSPASPPVQPPTMCSPLGDVLPSLLAGAAAAPSQQLEAPVGEGSAWPELWAPPCQAYFDEVLAAYARHSRHGSTTLKRLREVRLRGRKRTMVG